MRVAITGTSGRVGAALARHLAPRHEVVKLPREACDFSIPESLDATLETLECDVLLNLAALTSLEDCEDDPRLAMRVNSAAPGKLALWAARRRIRLIHFSTDYVFDGQGSIPLTEDMPARPLNAYGRSKHAGELAVLAHPGNLVLRVSWVFGPDKSSFVDQIFDAALVGQPLAAVADKHSLPTSADDLAQWVECLLDDRAQGLLHACNPGPAVTWHGLAEFVVQEMTSCGLLQPRPQVAPLRLDEMSGFRAPRPRFTVMDSGRLSSIIGGLRPWPEALASHTRQRARSIR